MRIKLILALLFTFPVTAQTVHQCNVDGNVVFQQTPCSVDEAVKVIPDQPRTSGFNFKTTEMTKVAREYAMVKKGQVAVGMSRESLLKSWGQPNKVNRSSSGADQWIYRRGRGVTQYVYVEDGEITAWSD